MIKRFVLVAMTLALLFVGIAGAQYPVVDMIAEKVIQKYQQSTCAQLAQEKAQPKPAMEQEAIQALRGNPQMRGHFIDKVAAPLANKLFECGMIP
jgi:hypothetical protein